jgi:hypothetical protein
VGLKGPHPDQLEDARESRLLLYNRGDFFHLHGVFEDLYLSHNRNPAQVYFTLSFESALRGVGIEKETHDPSLVVPGQTGVKKKERPQQDFLAGASLTYRLGGGGQYPSLTWGSWGNAAGPSGFLFFQIPALTKAGIESYRI